MKVTKRDGHKENFDYSKIYSAVDKAFKACDMIMPDPFKGVLEKTFKEDNPRDDKGKLIPLTVETIQDRIQHYYMNGISVKYMMPTSYIDTSTK